MSFEIRELSGALFKNDKGDNPKRPDYKGNCRIADEEYKISAWLKDGKRGKFLSLKFDAVDDSPAVTAKPKKEQHDDPISDEIPF